jgi:hypothetical protein
VRRRECGRKGEREGRGEGGGSGLWEGNAGRVVFAPRDLVYGARAKRSLPSQVFLVVNFSFAFFQNILFTTDIHNQPFTLIHSILILTTKGKNYVLTSSIIRK